MGAVKIVKYKEENCLKGVCQQNRVEPIDTTVNNPASVIRQDVPDSHSIAVYITMANMSFVCLGMIRKHIGSFI